VLAEDCFENNHLSAAIALLQVAARYAYPANVGLFNSPRLEELILRVGRRLTPSPTYVPPTLNGSRRKVLHVLSYGNPIGGDTRFAWRWIQEDRHSQHSVVITSQEEVRDKYDVPTTLRHAVEESGGCLRLLAAPISNPIEQACELRSLLQGMDVAVLHIYPYDVVPLLALAAGCESVATIFANVSDHTFWVGAGVAHAVVHLRAQSAHFLSHRRYLRLDDTPVLPIPLFHSATSHASIEAKRALGIDPDDILLLTIATPFKYRSFGRTGLLELVDPIIRSSPKAKLIAVGPPSEGQWWSASMRSNGRIAALGRRENTDLFYAAADIYLDSVPFSSITSLLEAGSRGLPLLGYDSGEGELGLLGPGAPGIDDVMLLANGKESYHAILTRLISEPDFRRSVGQTTRDRILSLHSGSGWLTVVHHLYTSVENRRARGCFSGRTDLFRSGPLNVALSYLYPSPDLPRLVAYRTRHLPYSTRRWITWQLYRRDCGVCVVNLLPRPTHPIISHLARCVKPISELAKRIRERRSTGTSSLRGHGRY
jgi:hypothetical protein